MQSQKICLGGRTGGSCRINGGRPCFGWGIKRRRYLRSLARSRRQADRVFGVGAPLPFAEGVFMRGERSGPRFADAGDWYHCANGADVRPALRRLVRPELRGRGRTALLYAGLRV